MSYKRPKTVLSIIEMMDKLLGAFEKLNKTPTKIHLTKDQYKKMVVDQNKILRASNKKAEWVAELAPYKGFDVGIYR